MVSRLRRLRHSHAGAERAAQAGHSAGEDLFRLGHRLLVAVPLLPEHLRHPRHSRPGPGDRHGREVRPARTLGVGGYRRRRQPLDRHEPPDPLPAAEPGPQHPAVQQPDLRPDQGPVLAHLGVRQEDQVEPLGDDRAADPSDARSPWRPKPPSWPARSFADPEHLGQTLEAAARHKGDVVRRDPARLRRLQRGRARQPGRPRPNATTTGSSSNTASRSDSARTAARGSCSAARKPRSSRSAPAACGRKT